MSKRRFSEEEVPVRDESFQVLGVRIPKELRRHVKLHCLETDVTVEAFVRAALEEKLHGLRAQAPQESGRDRERRTRRRRSAAQSPRAGRRRLLGVSSRMMV